MDKFWQDFATIILPSIGSYELQEYGEMCLCLQARDHLHSFENRRWHSDRILTVHNFSFEAWNASRPAVGLLILLAACSCSDPKPDVWPRFGLAHSRKAPAIDFYWRRPSPLFGHGEMTTLLLVKEFWPLNLRVSTIGSFHMTGQILTWIPQMPTKTPFLSSATLNFV